MPIDALRRTGNGLAFSEGPVGDLLRRSRARLKKGHNGGPASTHSRRGKHLSPQTKLGAILGGKSQDWPRPPALQFSLQHMRWGSLFLA